MSPPSRAGWREPILRHFTAELAAVSRLTVVADPDGLLLDPTVLDAIRIAGFEVVPFDDPVAFRLAHETRFRDVWDNGERTGMVVSLRVGTGDLNTIPFDLLDDARRDSRVLFFSIGDLFPGLAPGVVFELEQRHLDRLHDAVREKQPHGLGENATRDFILLHVFEVAPELIRSPADLLRVLLRRYQAGHIWPASVDARFIQVLRQRPEWLSWPLEEIACSRAAFLAFLQERWPLFLKRSGGPRDAVREGEGGWGLRYPGPADLPFDHDDVRVYVDSLFLEGQLSPANTVPPEAVRGTWMSVGVSTPTPEAVSDRMRRLLDRVTAELPSQDAGHAEWMRFGLLRGELKALRWADASSLDTALVAAVQAALDGGEERFTAWIAEHYESLHNLAFWPRPVMVHHVARFMAHGFPSGSGGRKALLVLDGLALDQWAVLREDLQAKSKVEVDDSAVFAWIPTLTSVSRQAIFAADPPFYFSSSIHQTSKEENHWMRFWEDRGVPRREIAYLGQKDQEPDATFRDRVIERAEGRCQVAGIVVGTVDQMLHGVVTGTGGLHASVRHWAESGAFRTLATDLLRLGFEVFVTADHGNTEAAGIGKPNVGAIADQRGARAHIFGDNLTRANTQQAFPSAAAWPQIGLPADYWPLVAPSGGAFILQGKRTVTHGGISVDEVLVPFAALRLRA